MTARSTRRHVVAQIESHIGAGRAEALYDVDAITAALIRRYGHRGTYPDHALIALMSAHHRGGNR